MAENKNENNNQKAEVINADKVNVQGTTIPVNNAEVEKAPAKASGKTKVVAIPVNPLNKKDDKIKVIINGKETVVKRGVQQTVSNAVYERLVIAGLVVEG